MIRTTSNPLRITAPRPPGQSYRRVFGRRWWAYLIVLVWAVAAGCLASQAANLEKVVESGTTAYLPNDSESSQVVESTESFGDEASLSATVIWTSPDKLTDADRRAIADQMERIDTEFGARLTSVGVVGPFPSDDGQAVQAVLPFSGTDTNVVAEHVNELREELQSPEDGEVAVTGPAGTNADMKDALGSIDLMLVAVTCSVILVILLAVYRSVFLPFLVIGVGVLALGSAMGALYLLASAGIIRIGAEVRGIISVLVLGCATDYALLLVDRFARELRDGADSDTAIKRAWLSSVEPITASAATVIFGLMCLLLSDLGLNRQLGPAGATGVFFAMLAMLTLMPAVLRLLGRLAFFPRKLKGSAHARRDAPARLAAVLRHRPRTIWVILTMVLGLFASATAGLQAGGLTDNDMVLGNAVESRAGQKRLAEHFGVDVGSPAIVLVDSDRLEVAREVIQGVSGVDRVQVWTGQQADAAAGASPVEVDGRVRLDAFLDDAPDSPEALATIGRLRAELAEVGGAPIVGGQSAVQVDFNKAAVEDRRVLILLLGVVFLVVFLLLRCLVAPLVVVASVVLSFLAAVGISTLVFQGLLGFPGVDASFPIHAFVFLVALGVDYSIFLMSRVREKVREFGPRTGMVAGLSETSGVITSAGIVLAATFAALGLVPLVLMVQLAFIVAFGVLLDTFIVRSLLVPALALDLGSIMWWPNRKLGCVSEKAVDVDEQQVAHQLA